MYKIFKHRTIKNISKAKWNIMKIRARELTQQFGKYNKLEKKFPVINQPIQIAPLLLISFIENAFTLLIMNTGSHIPHYYLKTVSSKIFLI